MQRIFIISIFCLFGCTATSTVATTNNLAAKGNNDVLILSALIRGHLKGTNGRELNLNELTQKDSLRRISNNFEKVEIKLRGGYISVFYKFSASRDNKVGLTSKEREMLNNVRWTVKALTSPYDGEIRFNYGERFYRIRQIIVNKNDVNLP